MTKRSTKASFEDLIRQKTLQGDKKGRNKRKRRSDKSEKTLADLMGQPPLLADEDPAQYFALYQTLRLKLEPRDILEEFYVRQVMDDAWLVIRYRRMNSHILNRAQPNLGDEIRLNIDRYRNMFMGSEDLLDQRDENLLLLKYSQYTIAMHPSDMIAKQFEDRIIQINHIESMISRCLERMRRSHITLDEFRGFIDDVLKLEDKTTHNQDRKTPIPDDPSRKNDAICLAKNPKEDDLNGK